MTISLPTYTGETTSLVMLTGNFLLDALILGSKWGTGPAGTGAVVTFSFPDGLNDFDTRSGIAGNYNALESTQSGFSAFLPAFTCLLYTSPSPRDRTRSRMPSSA